MKSQILQLSQKLLPIGTVRLDVIALILPEFYKIFAVKGKLKEILLLLFQLDEQ